MHLQRPIYTLHVSFVLPHFHKVKCSVIIKVKETEILTGAVTSLEYDFYLFKSSLEPLNSCLNFFQILIAVIFGVVKPSPSAEFALLLVHVVIDSDLQY